MRGDCNCCAVVTIGIAPSLLLDIPLCEGYNRSMATLNIALEEGFDNDRVIVSVNGKRFERNGVTTKLQIGLAEQFETNVADGTVTIDVDLPDRPLNGSYKLDATDMVYAGISAEGQTLRFRHSSQLFGYA
jgi:hypothetical protein